MIRVVCERTDGTPHRVSWGRSSLEHTRHLSRTAELSSMDYSNTQRFILAFKAGRALRRDGTNFVDPKPEKGAIILYDGEDDLLHFVWKDRATGNVEEVRAVFPCCVGY